MPLCYSLPTLKSGHWFLANLVLLQSTGLKRWLGRDLASPSCVAKPSDSADRRAETPPLEAFSWTPQHIVATAKVDSSCALWKAWVRVLAVAAMRVQTPQSLWWQTWLSEQQTALFSLCCMCICYRRAGRSRQPPQFAALQGGCLLCTTLSLLSSLVFPCPADCSQGSPVCKIQLPEEVQLAQKNSKNTDKLI